MGPEHTQITHVAKVPVTTRAQSSNTTEPVRSVRPNQLVQQSIKPVPLPPPVTLPPSISMPSVSEPAQKASVSEPAQKAGVSEPAQKAGVSEPPNEGTKSRKVPNIPRKKSRTVRGEGGGLSRYGMLAYSHLGRFKDAPVVSHSTIFLPKKNEITAPEQVEQDNSITATAPATATAPVPATAPTPVPATAPAQPLVPATTPATVPAVPVPSLVPTIAAPAPVPPLVPETTPAPVPATAPATAPTTAPAPATPTSVPIAIQSPTQTPKISTECTPLAIDLRSRLERELGTKIGSQPYVLDFYKEYDDGLVRTYHYIVPRTCLGNENLNGLDKDFLLSLETMGEQHVLHYLRLVHVDNPQNWNMFQNKHSQQTTIWTADGWTPIEYADLWKQIVRNYVRIIKGCYKRLPDNWDKIKKELVDGQEKLRNAVHLILKQISSSIECAPVLDNYRLVEVGLRLSE